jgi:hypothetical protein
VKKLLTALSTILLCAPFLAAQQGGLLDDYIIHIKPDKRADFDMISKKVAEANRKAKGDAFIAFEQMYGPDYTVLYVSTRENFAAIETGMNSFMASINEAYGVGGMKKFMADSTPTIQSAAGRLRARRMDLSINFPKDMNAYYQLVGRARYLRITEYRVKAGLGPQFEHMASDVKTAYEKNDSNTIVLFSQAVAGAPSGTFYVSFLAPNMAAFDSAPSLRKVLGDEDYMKFSKEMSECVEFSESFMYHVNPEWSNPPKEVGDVAPDYWHSKVVSMAKPKPKPAAATKAGTN